MIISSIFVDLQCGRLVRITASFAAGTDPDIAQVQEQNRCSRPWRGCPARCSRGCEVDKAHPILLDCGV